MTGLVDVEVREIRPADGPAYAELVATVYGETSFLAREPDEIPWRNDPVGYLHRVRDRGDSILVAEDAGRLVGYIVINRGSAPHERGTASVGIAVRQSHIGRGLGRRLMLAAEDWARAQGCHRIELGVMADNPRALTLYRGLGYTDEGRSPRLFRVDGKPVDDLVMAKLLRPDLPVWTPPSLPPVEPARDADRAVIRRLRPDDAAPWLDYQRRVRQETPPLAGIAAEPVLDLRTARRIVGDLCGRHGGIALLAVVAEPSGDRIVGHATAERYALRRLAHNATLGMDALRVYWAAGIGDRLLAGIEDWARAAKIERLNHTVLAANPVARAFFEKHGFVVETVAVAGVVIDGAFADRVGLAKFVTTESMPPSVLSRTDAGVLPSRG